MNLNREVIIAYSPADHSRLAKFLAGLKDKVERCSGPIVVVVDFNLIQHVADKSSLNVDRLRMRLFNDCIADLALREIAHVGARFMWTNKQVYPIESVLDRVLVSMQWEAMFPLCSMWVVMHIGSDHVPLLFSSGDNAPPRTRQFHFEPAWLLKLGFLEMVRDCWVDVAASLPRA